MATVSIVLGRHETGMKGAASGLPAGAVLAAEAITSSASSQQSAVAAITADERAAFAFWAVTASGGAVWVRIGTNPVAAAGDDWLIPDGATREFAAKDGQRIAVVDA